MIRPGNPVSYHVASLSQQLPVDDVEASGRYRAVLRSLGEIDAGARLFQIRDRGRTAKTRHRSVGVTEKKVGRAVRPAQYGFPVVYQLLDTPNRVRRDIPIVVFVKFCKID
jgi:hypothetical protein